MKIRFVERLIAALAGLCLVIQGLLTLIWGFGWLPYAWLPPFENNVFTKVCIGLLFILLGVFCCGLLICGNRDRKGFVLQNNENGEVSISVKAMESLVHKCLDKYDELKVLSINITNGREGVVVSLRIALANGISIPLAVNSLQKQVKQYLMACSGVDVQEVCVQVETTNTDAKDSPYKVADVEISIEKEPDAPEAEPLPREDATEELAAQQEIKPQKEKKPLHQRLFGHKEEEATVPVAPPSAEPAEEATEAEEPVTVAEEPAATEASDAQGNDNETEEKSDETV